MFIFGSGLWISGLLAA